MPSYKVIAIQPFFLVKRSLGWSWANSSRAWSKPQSFATEPGQEDCCVTTWFLCPKSRRIKKGATIEVSKFFLRFLPLKLEKIVLCQDLFFLLFLNVATEKCMSCNSAAYTSKHVQFSRSLILFPKSDCCSSKSALSHLQVDVEWHISRYKTRKRNWYCPDLV